MLRRRGLAAGDDALQVYASRDAGGMDHRHAYQVAAAALVDEVGKALEAPEGTPAREAVEAHVRAVCVRWGWMGRGSMREWHPVHLRELLSDDVIGEAWLKAKLEADVREVGRGGGGGEGGGAETVYEGPPLWERDEREAWRAREEGPCRARVALARGGGVAVNVTPAGGGVRGHEEVAAHDLFPR